MDLTIVLSADIQNWHDCKVVSTDSSCFVAWWGATMWHLHGGQSIEVKQGQCHHQHAMVQNARNVDCLQEYCTDISKSCVVFQAHFMQQLAKFAIQ
jgi:hypothetical protein